MKKIKLLALIAALATGLGVFFLIQNLTKPTVAATKQVVVAASDIAQNTTITQSMLKVQSVPADMVLEGAITDESQIVGKLLNASVVTGQQILTSQIATTGSVGGSTLAYSVKKGMRAVTVGVTNTSGLDGMIRAGNSVDIAALYKIQKGSATVNTTVLLLQNITVLAVDQNMNKNDTSSGTSYSTITLEVTPKQALKLCFTQDNASLRAILRSPLDKSQVSVPDITQNNVTSK